MSCSVCVIVLVTVGVNVCVGVCVWCSLRRCFL